MIEVSDYTGFPEMLDGRVKTLHPKIHGGLLALRDNPRHMESLKAHNIGLIDMAVVNLYPFEKTIQKPGVSIEEAIENIDIGGPSMLRSAAKNHRSVAVFCNPERYAAVLAELKENGGCLSERTRQELGIEVFRVTSHYDAAIYRYFKDKVLDHGQKEENNLPHCLGLNLVKIQDLRYGENPHQKAAFYRDGNETKGVGGNETVVGQGALF